MEARRELETAIQWGRFAEFFGFEDDSDELFLETTEPVSARRDTPVRTVLDPSSI